MNEAVMAAIAVGSGVTAFVFWRQSKRWEDCATSHRRALKVIRSVYQASKGATLTPNETYRTTTRQMYETAATELEVWGE